MRSLRFVLALASSVAACVSAPRAAPRSSVRAIVVRLRPGDDLKRELDALARRENLDAASILGTLSSRGSHLHIAVSDGEGHTVGGHLLEGSRVYTTAEVVVLAFRELRYGYEVDPTYGYHELVVRPR